MTTYNAGRLLQEAVESVVKQSFSDWELVVVDNASTDASTDNLEFTDARIRYIKLESNVGRTPALNIGLSACTGVYVAILDADDLSHPSRLGVQSQFLDTNIGHSLIGSEYETIDEGGRRIKMHRCAASPIEVEKSLGYTNVIAHSTAMYRRHFAIETGGYDESFSYAQDFEMTLRLMKLGEVEILPECLGSIRIHSNSETNKNSVSKSRIFDEYRCFRIVNSYLSQNSSVEHKHRQRLAITAIAMAYSEIKERNLRESFSYLIEGLKNDKSFSWLAVVARYFRPENTRT
jgi:glycosyltransferase involved in cell wall biosynthesis